MLTQLFRVPITRKPIGFVLASTDHRRIDGVNQLFKRQYGCKNIHGEASQADNTTLSNMGKPNYVQALNSSIGLNPQHSYSGVSG